MVTRADAEQSLGVDCEAGTAEADTWLGRVQNWLKSPWLIGAMVLGLVWALFQVAPLSEWREAFREASLPLLGLAVLLVLPHELLKVLRIEQLLPELRPQRLRHARVLYQMSCVAQLPVGTIGGDVFRICKLEELGATAEDATAATFIMRMIGFATTLSLAGIGGFVVLGSVWPLLGPVLGAVILLVLAKSQTPPKFLSKLVAHADDVPRNAFGRVLSAAARLLRHVFREAAKLSRMQMLRVLAVTLALYAMRGLIVWVCLMAINVDVSYLVALAALATGNLACAIPSPAGTVGLREGGMISILAGFGAAVAPATIGALLFRAAMILGAGLGLGLSMAAVSAFAKPLPAS